MPFAGNQCSGLPALAGRTAVKVEMRTTKFDTVTVHNSTCEKILSFSAVRGYSDLSRQRCLFIRITKIAVFDIQTHQH
jgi:Holliday junction resolvase